MNFREYFLVEVVVVVFGNANEQANGGIRFLGVFPFVCMLDEIVVIRTILVYKLWQAAMDLD